MNVTKEVLQRQIAEHRAKAYELFDEAKRIQNQAFNLPFLKRKGAMDKVYELQNEAIIESQKSTALKKELS